MARFRYREVERQSGCVHQQLVYTENAGWQVYQEWPCGQSPFPPSYFPRVSANKGGSTATRSGMVLYKPGCGPNGCTPQNETLRHVAIFVFLFFVALLIYKL